MKYYYNYETQDREQANNLAAQIATIFKFSGLVNKQESGQRPDPNYFGDIFWHKGIVEVDSEEHLEEIVSAEVKPLLRPYKPNQKMEQDRLGDLAE